MKDSLFKMGDFHKPPKNKKVAAFLAYAKQNVTPEVTSTELRHKIAMTLTSAVQYDQIDQDPMAGPILEIASQDLDFGPKAIGQDRFNEKWDKLVSLVSRIKK